MLDQITVVMVARNAEATIGRALRSALAAGAKKLLLVDDGSEDRTITAAEAAAGEALTLVRNPVPVSLGYVRDMALSHITTDYGLWLDADDEVAEDHIAKMADPLMAGSADLVFSDCMLVDGRTGDTMKELAVPDFMVSGSNRLRSFERNWYPSLHAGFRTEFAQKVGYDPAFKCVEDYDFLLRAITLGARVQPVSGCSYRYFHYDDTVSRDRAQTSVFTAKALEKHKVKEVESLLADSGLPEADRACILMSKAMFEGDLRTVFEQAGRVKASAFIVPSVGLAASEVARFYEGTAALITGDTAWAKMVLEPLGESGGPDVLNNLAVALAAGGDMNAAQQALEAALAGRPGYLDARQNMTALEAGEPLTHITRHPLRRAASRDGYQK